MRRRSILNLAGIVIVMVGLTLWLSAETPAPAPTAPPTAAPTRLAGEVGYSERWGSAWIDFPTPVTFKKGETLKLMVGGASRLIVRLRPKGVPADEPNGIVGGVITVPPDRIVEVRLASDYRDIVQVSVHGGPLAWDFDLGQGNKGARIYAVERFRP